MSGCDQLIPFSLSITWVDRPRIGNPNQNGSAVIAIKLTLLSIFLVTSNAHPVPKHWGGLQVVCTLAQDNPSESFQM